MKITLENDDTTVIIESKSQDEIAHEVVDLCMRAMIGLTYHELSILNAFQNIIDERKPTK